MLSKQTGENLKKQSFNFELHGDDLQFVLEKYKSIFQRKLHCIYAHDLEGNFLEANEAAFELLGYSRQEILAVNFADLIDADQFDLVLKTTEEIVRTGFQQEYTEYRLKRKDGRFVWIETDGSLINRDGKPVAILGMNLDLIP